MNILDSAALLRYAGRMKRALATLALMAGLVSVSPAQSSSSGGTVTTKGAITTGHCTSFAGPTQIQDAGATCGTGSGTVTSVSGTAPVASSGGATPAISITGVTGEQGNGSKLQLSTGTVTSNVVSKFDVNGNTINSQITDDGTHQATSPNGLGLSTSGGITFDKVNDTGTGTTVNLLVTKGSVAGTVVTAATSTKTGILGSAVVGIGTAPGTSGSTSVCFSGICSAVCDNTGVVGHYGIPSTTTAGRIHDTGATTPTANTDSFLITSACTVGTAANYEISTPDWFAQQAVAKVYQLQVAGGTVFTAGDNVNFNASTPAIPAGNFGVTFQTSKSSTTDSVSGYIAGPLLATGTSVSLTAPSEIYVCTGTCTVTPPVPAAGYEFCVMNDDNVATVITLAALGSSARYENTGRTAYGTAGTGTFVSGGAVKDMVCLVGRDSTHYLTTNFNGTWTAN